MSDAVSGLSPAKKILFSLLPLAFLVLVAEGGLRLLGFGERTGVEAMEFTFPLEDWRSRQGETFLERHPTLFWRPRPGVLGHNSHGTLGPELAVPKPDGLERIVCLGDSCTHFGPRPYPERWQAMLDARAPGRFEVVNAAVVGWSSHQGLVRLRTEVPAWEPDLVTVYFGWNDHWRALGLRDAEQPVRPAWLFALGRTLDRSRLVGALRGLAAPAERPAEPRVTLEEYAANLRAMKREADSIGSEVWFLTAPHALDLGIPAFLVESGEAIDPANLVKLHRAYNDVVRRVGRELGVTVIDLARELDRMDRAELFEADHIHLSDAGRTLVAAILYAAMLDRGMLAPGAEPEAAAGAVDG